MTGMTPFPQRALLLGVLWFPASFLLLWACAAFGWWSAHHMDSPLAIFFAALFLLAFLLQARIVVRAFTALRSDPEARVPVNYLLLAVGILTAVLAAGFAAVFGQIGFSD
jgi:hypothetical protein